MHLFRAVTVGRRGFRRLFIDVALMRRLVPPLRSGHAELRRRVAGGEAVGHGFVAHAFRHGTSFRYQECRSAARVHRSGSACEAAAMIGPIRLGMLTPSSNTTLEPITAAMLTALPQVSAHFSRFRVTEIALTSDALAQFDDRPILAAAELLAHAKVDADRK